MVEDFYFGQVYGGISVRVQAECADLETRFKMVGSAHPTKT